MLFANVVRRPSPAEQFFAVGLLALQKKQRAAGSEVDASLQAVKTETVSQKKRKGFVDRTEKRLGDNSLWVYKQ